MREKKKYIIIVRHTNVSLRIFYQVQKNKNRSILNYVISNLNIIDFYLVLLISCTQIYLKVVSHALLLAIHRTFRKAGK